MIVIYIMIAVSIIIAVLFLIIFIKSVKTGQYEDMYTPSVRMLFDDELIKDKPLEKPKSVILNKNSKKEILS